MPEKSGVNESRFIKDTLAGACLKGRESSPVGRPDFKPGWSRLRFFVGSTPTLFRHYFAESTKKLIASNRL